MFTAVLLVLGTISGVIYPAILPEPIAVIPSRIEMVDVVCYRARSPDILIDRPNGTDVKPNCLVNEKDQYKGTLFWTV